MMRLISRVGYGALSLFLETSDTFTVGPSGERLYDVEALHLDGRARDRIMSYQVIYTTGTVQEGNIDCWSRGNKRLRNLAPRNWKFVEKFDEDAQEWMPVGVPEVLSVRVEWP